MATTIDEPTTRKRNRRNLQLQLMRTALDITGRLSPSITSAVVFGLMIRPRRRKSEMTVKMPDLDELRIRHGNGSLQAYSWPGRRAVLLVHGWESSSADFEGLIPSLARAGWGGLIYDAPAHGRSDGNTTDFLELGRAFRMVLEEHGPFESVISHSFGSLVALHNLAESPGAAPASIVTGGAPTSLEHAFEIFTESLQLDPRVRSHLNGRIAARLGRPSSEFSGSRAVRRLDSKILVVHDRRDRMVPFESARRLARAARRGSIVKTSGLGHRGWLKHQPTIDRVVTFLCH